MNEMVRSGMVPTGLNSFKCTPRLPKDWDTMALRKIKAFQQDFDLVVKRKGKKMLIVHVQNVDGQILKQEKIKVGESVTFIF